MDSKIIRLMLIPLLLLTISSGVKAQFHWATTHVSSDWRNDYSFYALSCSGNDCTAVGSVYDNLKDVIGVRFWHSIDGGMTWRIQDPKLPHRLGYSNWHRLYSIQQIDAQNVVAIVDTGIIVRTFDGGATWEIQDNHSPSRLSSVHFSDPLTGIITASDKEGTLFTTTNGGRQWNTVKTGYTGLQSCRSYGDGKYRIFKRGRGPIYTTLNNWKTIDSSALLIDSLRDSIWQTYYFYRCNFTEGDTIVGYGWQYSAHAAIVRSTDAGKTWEQPVVFPATNSFSMQVTNMTPLDRDSVYATGYIANRNNILFSSDRGKTWRKDTLLFDTDFTVRESYGIAMNTRDESVVAFDRGLFLNTDSITSSVESGIRVIFISSIYPNPASSVTNVIVVGAFKTIHLIDILGRDVMQGVTSIEGKVLFDVSMLPRGVYSVLLDSDGRQLPVGKVATTGDR